jgi:hypothetical protein
MLLTIIENPPHPPPQVTSGYLIDSTPNLPSELVKLPIVPLSLINTSPVGTASLFSSSPMQGVDSIGTTHLIPYIVELLHPVPLPTYLGKSPLSIVKVYPLLLVVTFP